MSQPNPSCDKRLPFLNRSALALTSTGAWCPLLVGELQVQLFLTHLPDEHLEQAANHEQRIVSLPDKQLTVEEERGHHFQGQVKNRCRGGIG